MKVRIQVNRISLVIECRDTPTARGIYAALPVETRAQTWGDEVYFSFPLQANLEDDATDIIEPGEIAFWTEGSCIAIGFGPTPVSQGDEIRLAARTNIWGDSKDDVRQLSAVQSGDTIRIESMD